MKSFAATLFFAAIDAFLLCSLVLFLPPFDFLIEILHNAFFYAAIGQLFVLLFLIPNFRRQSKAGLLVRLSVVAFVFIVIGKTLAPFYVSSPAPTLSHGYSLKTLFLNVYCGNTNYAQVQDLIRAEDPDVLGLVELTPAWAARIQALELYPYREEVYAPHCYGLALYSKIPFAKVFFREVDAELPPVILAELADGARKLPPLRMALVHTRPPISNQALADNKILLRRLINPIRHDAGPIIVGGDFNATPFSNYYEKFRWGGGLFDAWWGRGLPGTWPDGSLFSLPLDHVLYKGNITPTDARVLEGFGSDHRALVVSWLYGDVSRFP